MAGWQPYGDGLTLEPIYWYVKRWNLLLLARAAVTKTARNRALLHVVLLFARVDFEGTQCLLYYRKFIRV